MNNLHTLTGFILGLVFSVLTFLIWNANFLKKPKVLKPFHDRHSLDFKVSRTLKRLSPRISLRWFVSRVTYGEDVLTSILSTLGLIDVVCYTFQPPYDDCSVGLSNVEVKMYYHTFRSFDDLEKRVYKDADKVKQIAGVDCELIHIGAVSFDTIWESLNKSDLK